MTSGTYPWSIVIQIFHENPAIARKQLKSYKLSE